MLQSDSQVILLAHTLHMCESSDGGHTRKRDCIAVFIMQFRVLLIFTPDGYHIALFE